MPTYRYECQACGHTLEAFQSMTENALRKCPACGKQKLQRLIGAGAGVIFKGSGFYETDYRSASYKADAKSGESGSSSDTKSSDQAGGAPAAKTSSGDSSSPKASGSDKKKS
ncbi:MAG: FmdB family zinc ribbon protein [Planctomycetota bacterium]|jgi:putative FmdB family regulatory protein